MFVSVALSFLWAAQVADAAQVSERPNERPNVLLILTDDQGWADAGVYGSTDLLTPTIDRIAAAGTRWTQFYAAAPVCSPSRAAFLSGRIPQRAGVPGNVSPNDPESGISPETTTIAEHFKAHGYATAQIGKWHLGHAPDRQPTGAGFDHGFGHLGGCIDNYSHFFYWNGPNRHDLVRNGVEIHEPGRFFPDLCVEEALRWVTDHQDTPWLMYFAINLPHYPYQGSPKWLEYYADLPMPRREYAAFLSTMDESLGELMTGLARLDELENTLVVFQADHGHSTEQRAFYGGGDAGPYRGAKFSLLEGGIRVPAILAGPGVPIGEVRGQMATACDWFPTLCSLAGVPLPFTRIEGKDLSAVLADEAAQSPHEHFFWQNGGSWAVRAGKWKLIWNANDTTVGRNWKREAGLRLYDLEADLGETKNVAAGHPKQVLRLRELAQTWDPSVPFEEG